MTGRLATCQEIADAYRRDAAAPFALDVCLGRTTVRLRTNTPELLDILNGHYREFTTSAGTPDIELTALDCGPVSFGLPFAVWEGADAEAKEEFVDLADGRVVRKRRTGLWLLFGPGGYYVLGPCRDHADQVINCLNARAADRELAAGARLFHAAGVSLGGAGLAVSGFAGAGKSTLALELVRRGADFVSNDRLFLGPAQPGAHELAMTGLARMPRVNPGTLLHNDHLAGILPDADRAAFAALPADVLRRLERKYDVPIPDCFGPGRFRLRTRLRALVVLAWQPQSGGMTARWTDLAASPDLITAFMKDVGVFFEQGPRRARVEDYQSLLAGYPVLVLEGGTDFDRAATMCLDLLGSPTVAVSVA